MSSATPRPLPRSTPLHAVLRLARSHEPLGVWLDCAPGACALRLVSGGRRRLSLDGDLGRLLRCYARIAVLDDGGIALVPACELRARRCLTVALAGEGDTGHELRIPLYGISPEAVLAELVRQGGEVRASRIEYAARPAAAG